MKCVPTVCVSKRAMMNASPRFSAVTTPLLGNGGRIAVVGHEEGERRHVAVRAVGVERPDDVTCCMSPLPVEHRALGIDLDPLHGRHVARVRRRSRFEPAHHRAIQLVALVEQLAAGVRHLARALLHQQAFGRQGQVDAPPGLFARQSGGSLRPGSKPNSDRRKPSLPRAAPWQLPVLQPELHEHRHHVELEADRHVLGLFASDFGHRHVL